MLSIFILAFIVGLVSGIITFIFGTGLNLITDFILNASAYNLILLPFVGFLTIRLRDLYKSEVNGSMTQIFMATREDKKLSPLIIPYQLICTWLAHLAGASVGREGVAVQLGATISNGFSTRIPEVDRRKFTRLGMAAGFAGLFGTPLAATVFSFEVTRAKKLDIQYIIATLIATMTATLISSGLGLSHFHLETSFVGLDFRQWLFFIFSIVIFVIVGHLFAKVLLIVKELNTRIKVKDQYKIFVFSIIGALLLYLVADGRYMSLGTNIIDDVFMDPSSVQSFDFLFKFGFTIYFIGIGFQGGEVTPLFAIGSSLGYILAYTFALPVTIVAGIGYAFVFGNATNGYVASAVLAVEVFGLAIAPYAIIALLITLLVREDAHTIYPNLEWE